MSRSVRSNLSAELSWLRLHLHEAQRAGLDLPACEPAHGLSDSEEIPVDFELLPVFRGTKPNLLNEIYTFDTEAERKSRGAAVASISEQSSIELDVFRSKHVLFPVSQNTSHSFNLLMGHKNPQSSGATGSFNKENSNGNGNSYSNRAVSGNVPNHAGSTNMNEDILDNLDVDGKYLF